MRTDADADRTATRCREIIRLRLGVRSCMAAPREAAQAAVRAACAEIPAGSRARLARLLGPATRRSEFHRLKRGAPTPPA